MCYATPKLIKHLNGFILSKFQISHYQRINTGCGSCYQVHISLRLLYRYQTTSSTLHSSRRWHRFNGIMFSSTKMSSSLSIRGSRKLRPRSRSRSRSCHRQASHLIRNEENHHHHHYHEYHDHTPIHAMQLSPSPSPKTKTKMVMMVDTGSSRGSNDGCDNDDDLFFGYPSTPVRRIVEERDNTRQLEQYSSSTPAGSTTRSFKIVSLDGCCEEVVSPLFPESSLQPLHYGDDIPMITSVASFTEDEDSNEDDNENEDSLTFSPTTITGRHGDRMDTNNTWDNNIDSDELIWMCCGNDNIIPSSSSNNHNHDRNHSHNRSHKRRGSGHNRSQFVLDGSFSFDSVPSPSPVHTSPSTITVATSNDPVCYSSPIIQTGTRTSMMIPPSVMITPPQHLLLLYDDEGLQRTLPPTHAEQRRRNKAMPSMQYENLILNRLRQQQQQQQQQQMR